MTGCPVNIADFRCRAIKGRGIRPPQDAGRPVATLMVVSRPEAERDVYAGGAPSAMRPVCDIGIAREAQRVRQRIVIFPVPMERQRNVIRFGEPKVRVMKAQGMAGEAQWREQPDDPLDFPPAA